MSGKIQYQKSRRERVYPSHKAGSLAVSVHDPLTLVIRPVQNALAACLRFLQFRKVITFEGIDAPTSYRYAVANSAANPLVFEPGISLTGGVVLKGWGPLPFNVYASSNISFAVGSSSNMPGQITGRFETPGLYTSIHLEVLDGDNGATYMLIAYDAFDHILDNAQVTVSAGSKAALRVSAREISYFVVAAPQVGRVNFAVERITFTRFFPSSSN